MKSISGFATVYLAAVLLIAGCDRIPGAGSRTLVVNLATVAVATGQDQSMQTQALTSGPMR